MSIEMLKRFHFVAELVRQRLLTPQQGVDVINQSANRPPKEFISELDARGLVVKQEAENGETEW